jgi:hypothetical protein
MGGSIGDTHSPAGISLPFFETFGKPEEKRESATNPLTAFSWRAIVRELSAMQITTTSV